MTLRQRLAKLLGRGEDGGTVGPVDKATLLGKIRQTHLFAALPDEDLAQMFDRMERVALGKGDIVVTEGDEGDFYYLLVSGTCTVSRRLRKGAEPEPVATLCEPQAFGEEALISNAKRNATVSMASDGVLMRLSKDAFNDYVKEPLLTWYSPSEAVEKVRDGARWVDVRDEGEAQDGHLHGAVLAPMDQLRAKSETLDPDTAYICYCRNGRLSSTAAFLLRQRGFKVGVLRGGVEGLRRAGCA